MNRWRFPLFAVGVWTVTFFLLWLIIGPRAWGLERKFCGDLAYVTMGEASTLTWNPNPVEEAVTGYEIRWHEQAKNLDYAWFEVATTTWTGIPPRTGTFIVMVRAVNAGGVSAPTPSNSKDPLYSPEPWCYYVVPAPPGGGVIE
jgi:hypothetical protein